MKRKTLPNVKRWEKIMLEGRNAAGAILFIARVQARYEELMSQACRYRNKALRFHFEDNILPAVAAYSVLMMDGVPKDAALQTLDRLLEASLESQRRFYHFWARFPFFFGMLKLALKPMMKMQYSEKEWKVEWIDFTSDIVGLNCHACFYMNRLAEYGLAELTSHFCRLDDVLAAEAAPRIRLERTQTIGRGGSLCDFRYIRVKAN